VILESTDKLDVTSCDSFNGCHIPDAETHKRRAAPALIWPRADVGEGPVGEGPAGEGAPDEGSPGEGPQSEGPQGEGPQGEGPQGEGGQGPGSNSPTTSEEWRAGSDGTLPDRNSDDISIGDNTQSAINEVLDPEKYKTKGQGYWDLMMGAVHRNPRQDVQYRNYNERYRVRTEQRTPLDPDPEESGDLETTGGLQAVLWIQGVAAPPEIGIDFTASDWTFKALTSKAKPVPKPGGLDKEDDATIAGFVSKSQKTILVTSSDSIDNDPDVPNTQKLPNSELIFQILTDQFGDTVADTQFIIEHPVVQAGTITVITAAHAARGIAPEAMATWTVADGDIWLQLLGTRNARPSVFMATDHPNEMRCKTVMKIYTWALCPGATSLGKSSMVLELGNDVVNC
jgi:hypothetical protein